MPWTGLIISSWLYEPSTRKELSELDKYMNKEITNHLGNNIRNIPRLTSKIQVQSSHTCLR